MWQPLPSRYFGRGLLSAENRSTCDCKPVGYLKGRFRWRGLFGMEPPSRSVWLTYCDMEYIYLPRPAKTELILLLPVFLAVECLALQVSTQRKGSPWPPLLPLRCPDPGMRRKGSRLEVKPSTTLLGTPRLSHLEKRRRPTMMKNGRRIHCTHGTGHRQRSGPTWPW